MIKKAAWDGRIPLLPRNLVHWLWGALRHGTFTANHNSRRMWNDVLSEVGDFWRDEHYRKILEYLPPDESFSLLDIGCAIGDGCRLLAERFPKARIAGADLSRVGIEKARTLGGDIEYFMLDIRKDGIPSGFDYIALLETLEHFDNPFEVLDRCLSRAGKAVVITVPYSENGSGRIEKVGMHRWSFDEHSFDKYNCNITRITDYIPSTNSSCIVCVIDAKGGSPNGKE